MPVQINEVVVRTTVDTSDEVHPATGPGLSLADTTEIEKELVLEIIEEFISDKKER